MKIQVTVLIFSGRPNPVWELKGKTADEFIHLWEKLPSAEISQSETSQLGYQGCRLDLNPNEYILLFDGYGYLSKENIRVLQKKDIDRELEKFVLDTAPPDHKDLIGSLIKFQ